MSDEAPKFRLRDGIWCPVCGRDLRAISRRFIKGEAGPGEQDPRPEHLVGVPCIASIYEHKSPMAAPCFIWRTWDDGERVRDREDVPMPSSIVIPVPGTLPPRLT